MPLAGYLETLSRFGIEKLHGSLDLQLTKGGDIAATRDGHMQFGSTQGNALFRLIERWRHSETVINELFGPMLRSARQFEDLSGARARDQGPSLGGDPKAYHDVTDAIVESRLIAATLAGSIAVILHSLLMRFKLDLNASEADWEATPPLTGGFSLGQVFTATAANFRHYDEWAAAKKVLSKQQVPNMTVLCGVLGLPLTNLYGYPTLRENVCSDVLMKITNGSVNDLHAMIFEFAKRLAKF